MADVLPLKGLRYNQEKIEDLTQVITPPFDIIDTAAQERYYARNPYNAIRLERGKSFSTDTTLDNVYTRAAATFSEWRLDDVLQQEESPCYYLYQQRFSYAGQHYTRTSLLARVRLEPWSSRVILPHEHTRQKDKEDRLQLLHACAANFSPIMCMYDDPQERIRRLLQSHALNWAVQLVDEEGEEHFLQPITDQQERALIQDFFAQRQLYIADGHHRYTTALQYRDELATQRVGLDVMDGANFVLMALIDVNDPGMLVLPTHRLLVDLSQEALQKLTPEPLAAYFTVQQVRRDADAMELQAILAVEGQQRPVFLLQTEENTLLLSTNDAGQRIMKTNAHSEAWNALDVALVQKLLLETVLGITEEDVTAGRYVRYTHDARQALQSRSEGQAQVAILLNGIPFRQVRDVALADDRMPQKSTYLYPKLITGLVMNPLW
jgi:uncharacterized protein (DUF1015 family)